MRASKKKIAAAFLILKTLEDKKLKKRSVWCHEWLLKRGQCGAFSKIMNERRIDDPMQMGNFLKISPTDFEDLANRVGSIVTKKDTRLRKAIKVQERLAITLRYFASGDSYFNLSIHFRVHRSTICNIVKEISAALVECLEEFMKVPKSQDDWMKIENDFEKKWNFPRCRGAVDGKHIVLENNRDSIALMALVDANYKFIVVSAGYNKKTPVEDVFKSSGFSSFLADELHKQKRHPLPGRKKNIPSVIVADDAFPLQEDIMKPFPCHLQGSEKKFNYRLSRARRMVENAFGVMASIFHLLRLPIYLSTGNVDKVILAICYLHNYLMTKEASKQIYAPDGTFDKEQIETGEIIPGIWRTNGGIPDTNMLPLSQQESNNSSSKANEIREEFKNYFISPKGEVSWQYKFI